VAAAVDGRRVMNTVAVATGSFLCSARTVGLLGVATLTGALPQAQGQPVNPLGWRALAMTRRDLGRMALATGAYFSTRFLIDLAVQVKTAGTGHGASGREGSGQGRRMFPGDPRPHPGHRDPQSRATDEWISDTNHAFRVCGWDQVRGIRSTAGRCGMTWPQAPSGSRLLCATAVLCTSSGRSADDRHRLVYAPTHEPPWPRRVRRAPWLRSPARGAGQLLRRPDRVVVPPELSTAQPVGPDAPPLFQAPVKPVIAVVDFALPSSTQPGPLP